MCAKGGAARVPIDHSNTPTSSTFAPPTLHNTSRKFRYAFYTYDLHLSSSPNAAAVAAVCCAPLSTSQNPVCVLTQQKINTQVRNEYLPTTPP